MGMITITITKRPQIRPRTRDNGADLASLYADLYERLHRVSEVINGKTHDDFNPDDHPHAPAGQSNGGQFVSHGGGGAKPTSTKAKAAKAAMHELFSSGHPFTKQELMTIAGVKTEKLFSDYMAMLKNPKYAGSAGALQIKKLADGSYQIVTPDGKPAPPPPPAASPKEEAKPKVEAPAEVPKPVAPAAKKLVSTKGMTPKQMDAAFQKHTVAEVQEHFKEKFGLGFTNGLETKTKLKKLSDEFTEQSAILHYSTQASLADKEKALERREQIRAEMKVLHSEARSHQGNVRGHNQVDIDSGTSAAKQQRKILAQLDAALEHMQEQGYDIKSVLETNNVSYIAGSPSKSIGHAWVSSRDGKGYFSLSGTKNVSAAHHKKQEAAAASRVKRGEPIWSVSTRGGIDEQESARSTVIHELAHALGLQKGIDSPGKLGPILGKLRAQGHMPAPELPEGYKFQTGKYDPTHHFIANKISQYATSNIKETDAELAAMVTSPHYKPGTLPKELENHVHALFNKKQS